jgi:hypothetical protein
MTDSPARPAACPPKIAELRQWVKTLDKTDIPDGFGVFLLIIEDTGKKSGISVCEAININLPSMMHVVRRLKEAEKNFMVRIKSYLEESLGIKEDR